MKVLIADDERLARERLHALLSELDGIEFVGVRDDRRDRPFVTGQGLDRGREERVPIAAGDADAGTADVDADPDAAAHQPPRLARMACRAVAIAVTSDPPP